MLYYAMNCEILQIVLGTDQELLVLLALAVVSVTV